MNTKTILLLGLSVAGMVTVACADLDVGLTAEIRLGRALPPPPPEVVVVEPVGPPAPPPWTATHWYHRSYAYYYYPGSDVYFRPSDRLWFYLDGRTWRGEVRLPEHIRVDFGRAVSLKLETSRPYTLHDRVVAYYPANYFARVRFRNGHDNRPDHDDRRDRDDRRDHDDGDDHGKGHSKDKRK